MTAIIEPKTANPREHVLAVSFMKVGKLYYFDFKDFPDLEVGDHVIVQTSNLGLQMGQIKAFRGRENISPGDIQRILRPASPADLLMSQQWKDKEVPALIDCREKAKQMGGYEEAKFIAAEYNFDGTVITYLYTTDEKNKLNMNRLRSAMQKMYGLSVEFRQIGPRDVAKVQEGFGACGIPRCCSTFLTEFSMISINMAKAQNISLNPAEITGMCGRLRCCLIYEYEQYVEARKHLPKLRKRIGTPHGEGRVVEVHPLRDGVTVEVDDNYHFITREEIIPLAEWEALRDAAASPCSKNEGGGCDCGAKRPRGSAKETLAEMGLNMPDEAYEPQTPDEDEDDLGGEIIDMSAQSARPERENKDSQPRRGNQRRRRKKGGRKPGE